MLLKHADVLCYDGRRPAANCATAGLYIRTTASSRSTDAELRKTARRRSRTAWTSGDSRSREHATTTCIRACARRFSPPRAERRIVRWLTTSTRCWAHPHTEMIEGPDADCTGEACCCPGLHDFDPGIHLLSIRRQAARRQHCVCAPDRHVVFTGASAA